MLLHHSGDLPPADSYAAWFAVTGSAAMLEAARRPATLGRDLEAAFDATGPEWWEIGRRLAEAPGGDLAHAPTGAAYATDFGLMLAWARLTSRAAADRTTTLVVCDDPWVFRHLAEIPGVRAGRAPRLRPRARSLALRGVAARIARALALAWTALVSWRFVRKGGAWLLAYGHPASTAAGDDAYFGLLLNEIAGLRRALHTDCPPARARALRGDGRTVSLHAFGNPLFALGLAAVRWRPRGSDLAGPAGWLVRRAAAIENGTAALAMTRWQAHCQERWLGRVRPAVVAWPWENHPWERIFCRAARARGVATLGYQHMDAGRHQLNMGPAGNRDGLESLPDHIVLNGPAYRAQFLRWGIPPARIETGGAFRLARPEGGRYDPGAPVFVALSSIAAVAAEMMEAVMAARRPGRTFLVKDHPMYPFAFAETDDVRRTTTPQAEHERLSAVFYGTGGSGIEALLAGIPTFRLLPADRVGIDTLPEGMAAVTVAAAELGAALDDPPPPPTDRWEDFFSPADIEGWRRLLSASPLPEARP